MVSRARPDAPGDESWSETRRPDAATTWAIPLPIWPAPITSTCGSSMAADPTLRP